MSLKITNLKQINNKINLVIEIINQSIASPSYLQLQLQLILLSSSNSSSSSIINNNNSLKNENEIILEEKYFKLTGETVNEEGPYLQYGRFSGIIEIFKGGNYKIKAICDEMIVTSDIIEVDDIVDLEKIQSAKLNSDETVAVQNLFNLLKWRSKEESVGAVAGLMAIQKHSCNPNSLDEFKLSPRSNSSIHLNNQTHQNHTTTTITITNNNINNNSNNINPPTMQFVIQDYHVKGPCDRKGNFIRWYKDEGRKEDSNIEFMVLIRDMLGNKMTLPQPVTINVQGCYEDGEIVHALDGSDIFDLNTKRSRLIISPEVDFAIVCGRFKEVSKKHNKKNFCVCISASDLSLNILSKLTPSLSVASKRRVEHQTNIKNEDIRPSRSLSSNSTEINSPNESQSRSDEYLLSSFSSYPTLIERNHLHSCEFDSNDVYDVTSGINLPNTISNTYTNNNNNNNNNNNIPTFESSSLSLPIPSPHMIQSSSSSTSINPTISSNTSLSGIITGNKKRRLSVSEWVKTVTRVTNQLRWTETYFDEKEMKEYSVAPLHPNKIIDDLIRLCPVQEPFSPPTSPE